MGVRRCLARSLTSLALPRTPKSANGPRSNSFRPDSPSTTNFPRGRKTQPSPSPPRTWSVPDASSQPGRVRNGPCPVWWWGCLSLPSRGFGIAGWRRRYCGFVFAGRSRISFSPSPPEDVGSISFSRKVFAGTKDSAKCIGPVRWPAAAECLTR